MLSQERIIFLLDMTLIAGAHHIAFDYYIFNRMLPIYSFYSQQSPLLKKGYVVQ